MKTPQPDRRKPDSAGNLTKQEEQTMAKTNQGTESEVRSVSDTARKEYARILKSRCERRIKTLHQQADAARARFLAQARAELGVDAILTRLQKLEAEEERLREQLEGLAGNRWFRGDQAQIWDGSPVSQKAKALMESDPEAGRLMAEIARLESLAVEGPERIFLSDAPAEILAILAEVGE